MIEKGSILYKFTHYTAILAVLCLSSACFRDRGPQEKKRNISSLPAVSRPFSPSTGTHGGEFRLALYDNPQTLNPLKARDPVSLEVIGFLYEGLAAIDPVTGRPMPHVAERWEVSADGLTWTFFLRDSLFWSDSTPFSAEDVAFTLNEIIYNEDIRPNYLARKFRINGKPVDVEILDSTTVCFTLPHPYAPFPHLLTRAFFPLFSKGFLDGKDIPEILDNQLSAGIVRREFTRLAPFLTESFVPSHRLTLRRNPCYWKSDSAGKPLPYFERISWRIVPDRNQELALFRRASLDYMALSQRRLSILTEEAAQNGYVLFETGDALQQLALVCNLANASGTGKSLLASPKARRALAYALDVDQLIEKIYQGKATASRTSLAGHTYFHNPRVQHYSYNASKAASLLQEAGLTSSDTITLLANSNNAHRRALIDLMAANLNETGTGVRIVEIEQDSLMRLLHGEEGWDAALIGISVPIDPHFAYDLWHSEGSLHLWNLGPDDDQPDWQNRIDAIFDSAVTVIDTQMRTRLYNEWQQLAADYLPIIPLLTPHAMFAISSRIKNVYPAPFGGVLHNIEYLYFTQDTYEPADPTK
ncbi:MAG: hypothetical protein GF398_11325 [Chitinivibrionales bacterium]|nr:hypothetical protein [Chitinivibrionales bacterium]